MISPFLIDYGPSMKDLTGLVVPINDTHCMLYWSDGKSGGNLISINFILHYFNKIKIDATGQEILAWRLKYGV